MSLLSGHRVLVVEDTLINQILAREFLKRLGLTVDVAENGKIALELLAEQRYLLVLMDLHMPEMDGFETTRQIRRCHTAEQLPIIAMTADAFEDVRRKCLAEGMNDFVPKPFQLMDLRDKLNHWADIALRHAPKPYN